MGNQQVKTADCNWLAGLFDGEGCLTFVMSPRRKRANRDTYSPWVFISNTDQDILEEVIRILSELELPFHVYHEKPQRPGYKPKWVIRANGVKRAQKWLEVLLLPYLRLKQHQAQDMARILASRLQRDLKSGFTTEEIHLINTHFRQQSRSNPQRLHAGHGVTSS